MFIRSKTLKRIRIGKKYCSGIRANKIITTDQKERSFATNMPHKELQQIKKIIKKSKVDRCQ